MKNLSILLFLILFCTNSANSQYFQLGSSIGGGLNFNHMKEIESSPYQTKSELVASYYFDISYCISKKMYIEINIGIMGISSFIERNSSKIGTNNSYSNFGFSQQITNIPVYINYEILSIKNKYSLRGLFGVNNLFPTEIIGYGHSEDTPTSTLFDNLVYGMHPDYSICLIGGLALEKKYQRGNRLGLKFIYQQGFKEIAYQQMYYTFNGLYLDKSTRSYNNGSQINLYFYYYWGPLGKKYRIKKTPKTELNILTQ